MIYLFVIYIIFQLLIDQWGLDTVNTKIVYFAFQYGWIAALAILQAIKGKYYVFYYGIAFILIIISLNELRSWNLDATTYAMMVSPPAISIFSLCVIALFFTVLILERKQWNGLKRTFGRRS